MQIFGSEEPRFPSGELLMKELQCVLKWRQGKSARHPCFGQSLKIPRMRLEKATEKPQLDSEARGGPKVDFLNSRQYLLTRFVKERFHGCPSKGPKHMKALNAES